MTTTSTGESLLIPGAPSIDGLRFRRPSGGLDDYTAMAELIGQACQADGVPWWPTGRTVRDEIEGSEGMTLDDVVLAEVDGRLIAEAKVDRVVRDGVVCFDLDGHVHPDVRRRGLGRALLDHNIARADRRASEEPDGQEVDLRGFAEQGEVGHHVLLVQEAFEAIRFFFLMQRDLAGPIPDVALPAGIDLRPMTPALDRPVFDAEAEAFRDHWGHHEPTKEDFRRTFGKEELDRSLWIVAWDGDEIAGVVQNWIWPEENQKLGVEWGWLEHISVRRPWRRRGIARAITAASLRLLRDQGLTHGMLGVDAENPNGALGLYEGLGFSVFTRSTAYRRPSGRSRTPKMR
jgi:mycothiol synthase